MRKANEAEYFFICGGLDTKTFQVTSFKGTDTLSTLYSFTIQLIATDQDIDPTTVVGKRASLYIYRDEEYYPYSGVISEFRVIDRTDHFASYSVQLVPRLWLTTLNIQTRVFQCMTCRAIVKQVLTDAGLSDCCEFKWNESAWAENEFVVQYQESDFNFITRLMEREGTHYRFAEPPLLGDEITGEPSGERIIFCDADNGFADIDGAATIRYRSHSGLHEVIDENQEESMSRVELCARAATSEAYYRNYNYRTPEVALSGTRAVEGGLAGTLYEYGGEAKTSDTASQKALVLANRLASGQITMGGNGNCRGLRAGHRFTLSEHPRSDFNTGHVILTVTHSGSQNGAGSDTPLTSYENSFTSLSAAASEKYCPPVRSNPVVIPGVITAMIEANGGDYALLDESGRYKVRLPFDVGDKANSEASKYVRLSSPYAGANYGMHFPSHEGSEMVLACVNGDPDKILGLATVPNANTVSPVTSTNKEQSVIRTAGGNEIVLDDLDGEQRVRLTTSAAHVLEMDDGNRRIVLQSTDQNKVLLDDENERCDFNAADQVIVLSYKSGEEGITISTGNGHVIKIDDANKMLTIQTTKGHVIEMDDSGGTLTLTDCKGKNTVTLDGSKGLILDSKGKITINASQDIEIKGKNIKMETATGGKIEAKASMGDMLLEGKNFSAKAALGDVKIEGQMNVALKGSMAVKAEGGMGMSKLELGPAGAKVSGLMAELSGTAMTTVKGAVVMIN